MTMPQATSQQEGLSEEAINARATVEKLLTMSGISPTPSEIDQLVAMYPAIRANMKLIYEMPGVRHEQSALVFQPLL